MKALVCRDFGPIDNLAWEDIIDPSPKKGEVIVNIKAAALNFPDNLIVRGLYQFKPNFPFSPGSEGAGVISDIGENVENFKIGDKVSFICGWGSFAEKIAINHKQLIKIPEGMTFELASATQLTYGTSYHALIQRGRLIESDEILILGCSGGTGLAALDIAKAHHARVIAGVSSEEKATLCKRYGADDVVIYGSNKLDKNGQKELSIKFKEKSKKGGFDIIYDPIGDCYTEPALRSINWKGRYLVVGFAAGEIPKIPLNLTLLKGCEIVGVFWGAFTGYEPKNNIDNIIEIGKLLKAKKINPFISKELPMKSAVDAIRMIGERKVLGKVVLVNE
ncbi:NADPH:quinone oxidoreductase family protein [Candidatus Marinimicrobia bacterium]|nr:NADPH:quinone oxidoreductase family protein [Candidatus Neomarinimicrobiota bacterium]